MALLPFKNFDKLKNTFNPLARRKIGLLLGSVIALSSQIHDKEESSEDTQVINIKEASSEVKKEPNKDKIDQTKSTKSNEENLKARHVVIDRHNVNIDEVKPYDRPVEVAGRRTYFPATDEAREIIESQKNEEELVVFYEGKSSTGMPFRTRESLSEAFELANKYAEMEGFCIFPNSSYRSRENQQQLYRKTSKKRRGKWVAGPDSSLHRRGAAIDVQLCKLNDDGVPTVDENDEVAPLTSRGNRQDKDYNDHLLKLKKYMSMAGFANYKVEHWHWEIGSIQSLKLMEKVGYIDSSRGKVYRLLHVK